MKIKGLAPFVPEEEFFDEALLKRVEEADKNIKPKVRVGDKGEEEEPSKASRHIPKDSTLQVKQIIKNKPPKNGPKLVAPITDEDED